MSSIIFGLGEPGIINWLVRQRASRSVNRLAVVGLFAVAALAGCGGGQPPRVIDADPEPGVYKGAVDPLTQASSEKRAARLAERFNLVQGRQ